MLILLKPVLILVLCKVSASYMRQVLVLLPQGISNIVSLQAGACKYPFRMAAAFIFLKWVVLFIFKWVLYLSYSGRHSIHPRKAGAHILSLGAGAPIHYSS